MSFVLLGFKKCVQWKLKHKVHIFRLLSTRSHVEWNSSTTVGRIPLPFTSSVDVLNNENTSSVDVLKKENTSSVDVLKKENTSSVDVLKKENSANVSGSSSGQSLESQGMIWSCKDEIPR